MYRLITCNETGGFSIIECPLEDTALNAFENGLGERNIVTRALYDPRGNLVNAYANPAHFAHVLGGSNGGRYYHDEFETREHLDKTRSLARAEKRQIARGERKRHGEP